MPKPSELRSASVQTSHSTQEAREIVDDTPDPDARLWLANLDFRVNEEMIVEYLSTYASVENIYMPKVAGGGSKGYAFVEFSTPSAAMDVLSKVNGQFWKGRRLVVRRAVPRGN